MTPTPDPSKVLTPWARRARAAYRHKRVLTDPDVAVVLDALLEDDERRAVQVAASTSGRVWFESLDDGQMTAAAFGHDYNEDETFLGSAPCTYVPGTGTGDYETFAHGDAFVIGSWSEPHGTGGIVDRIEFYDEHGERVHEINYSSHGVEWMSDFFRERRCAIPRSAIPRYQFFLRQFAKQARKEYGDDLDLSPGTYFGRWARQLARAWLEVEQMFDAQNLDRATGAQLDAYMKLINWKDAR